MDPARHPRPGPRPALKSWRERLARWLRPPRRLRPTRAGWVFFAITFGVGFAALNTGNNLLYLVLSLMLSFLVLSGVLSESALRGIEVRRRLPRELFAGQDGVVELAVGNAQRRVAAFAIVVEDRVRAPGGPERAAGRVFALRIGPGERARCAYRLRPEARGPLEFTGFRVFTRFPFGLFSKSLTLPGPATSLVYPEIERVAAPPEFGRPRQTGDRVVGGRGRGSEAAGLREFALGDSIRHVHWRASVRRGELLVRDVESEHDAEVEVRLATWGVEPGDRFERSVSWVASEVVALLEAETRVALRTDTTRIEADNGHQQRARLLSFLARVAPESAPAGLR